MDRAGQHDHRRSEAGQLQPRLHRLHHPIQNSLGLSAAAIGWADTLGRLMGGIQGPVMGYMTDKLGPGFMLGFGGVTSGLGFILLSYTGNYFSFLLVFVA